MKSPHDNFVLDDYPQGSVTQWFGENPVLYSRFGFKAHNGIDSVAPWGSPLYAIEDGYIVDVNDDPKGYGKYVRLRSARKHDGAYREWTYGHLSEIRVKGGQPVLAGDVIGDMGNTGFVVSGATPFWEHNPYAGTHLHLTLRLLETDPYGWKHKHDTIKYKVRHYDNGHKGAIDPVFILRELRPNDRRPKMLTLLSATYQLVGLLKKLKNK
jgi:murein DD-endopeptidase MepM/ murein hydrolase activator NlpD